MQRHLLFRAKIKNFCLYDRAIRLLINAFTSFFDILALCPVRKSLDFDARLLPRGVFGAPGAPTCVSLRLIRSPDFSAFAAFAAAALNALLPIALATALPALFAAALIAPLSGFIILSTISPLPLCS